MPNWHAICIGSLLNRVRGNVLPDSRNLRLYACADWDVDVHDLRRHNNTTNARARFAAAAFRPITANCQPRQTRDSAVSAGYRPHAKP